MSPNAVTSAFVIRTVASSLCFDQDPAPIRQLDKARAAAAAVTRALVDAGIVQLVDGDDLTPSPVNDDPPLPLVETV